MINSSNFRDKIITGIAIKYAWDSSLHSATLTLSDQNGIEKNYKLYGLLEFSICDDFGTMYVSQAKMINTGDQIYLSLDPLDELNQKADYCNDNFWFQFSHIEIYKQ